MDSPAVFARVGKVILYFSSSGKRSSFYTGRGCLEPLGIFAATSSRKTDPNSPDQATKSHPIVNPFPPPPQSSPNRPKKRSRQKTRSHHPLQIAFVKSCTKHTLLTPYYNWPACSPYLIVVGLNAECRPLSPSPSNPVGNHALVADLRGRNSNIKTPYYSFTLNILFPLIILSILHRNSYIVTSPSFNI